MRVIVCGGRNYTDARGIYAALGLLRTEVAISGCQTGADTIALNWASERGVETAKYPYLVDFGRSGGPKRNQQMLEEGKPDLVLAFPGGRGTADMVRRGKERGNRGGGPKTLKKIFFFLAFGVVFSFGGLMGVYGRGCPRRTNCVSRG